MTIEFARGVLKREPRWRGEAPDPEAGILLATRGLTKQFGGLTAVNEVDLNVPKASISGLIGPNGSGKTTTINLLSGHYLPTRGVIFWDGGRIERLPAHRRGGMGIMRTFQSPSLFPDLSVHDNVLAGCYRLGKTGLLDATLFQWRERADRHRLEEKVQAALDITGLTGTDNILAKNLTFGQQKMVDLARALAAEPGILLLDEPAAGLNPKEVNALADILRLLKSRHQTVLLIEHNMRLVMGICDGLTVLNFGKVIARGRPDEIRANKQVIEAYLGGGVPHDASS